MAGRRSALLAAVAVLSACAAHGARAGTGGGAGAAGPIATPTASSTTAAVQVTTTLGPSTSRPAVATTRPVAGAAPSAPSAPSAPAVPCAVPPQPRLPSVVAASMATALAFAPDGRMFFAERSGTVRVVQGGAARVFATVPTITAEAGGGYSERGLLGLAIDPQFSVNHYVYAFYSDADRSQQQVVRWTDCAGVASASRTIIRLPSGADCCHKGGRLAFGPDGKLYVTLGDEHSAPAAQSASDVRGKVLRYNADGTIPGDNPFGPGDPVWAYGFRNPFGIAFSAAGQLAVTNNGPSGEIPGGPATGYDTVLSAVVRGGGYQWPNCYGYSHPLLGVAGCGIGQFGPDWSSETATVVPTGAAFVDASGPAGYAGHLVFCTFAAGMKILTAHAAVTDGPQQCRLDVKQGPDHALYYSDAGNIYRLG